MKIIVLFFLALSIQYTFSLEWSLAGCTSQIPPKPNLKNMHEEIRSKFTSLFASYVGTEVVVFMFGGVVRNRYDTDTEIAFRQESNFLYLTGVNEPDYAFAIDMEDRRAILFAPVRDEQYALWNGEIKTPEELKQIYGMDDVILQDEMIDTLQQISNYNEKTIYIPDGQSLPDFTNVNDEDLIPIIASSRVTKTESELDMMRISARISSDAHIALMKDSRVGLYEYNYGAYFVYYTTSCGLLSQSYEPIAGCGNRSAILHYRAKQSQTSNGDIILIDAGAEYYGYGTDITRTYPVNGHFTPSQVQIYEMVESVVEEVESEMKAGMEWSIFQRIANHGVCKRLLDAGFLRGSLNDLIQNRMWQYFFPHGLGHSVGLEVHDPGFRGTLLENMVITVEPGIYFNRAYVQMALDDPIARQYIVVEKVMSFLDANFGGVRIEDTVIVKSDGIENITLVPKSVKEIEEIMNEGKVSLLK